MRIGIVGCSISGAYLAWRLAEIGHDVFVFERKSKIGGKPCSGLISERLWEFIPRNNSLIENEIEFVKIHFPKKTVEVRFRKKMLAVDRDALDSYAAGLAKKAGAEIFLNSPVSEMDIDAMEIISKRRRFQFDLIIGCDGANSFVRKSLGLMEPKFRIGMYVYENRNGNEKFVSVWPTPEGFFWRIPHGRKKEWGMIGEMKNAPKKFGVFLSENEIEKTKVFSALIPEGPVVSTNKKIILCGDAAGLTKNWSGGGVIWGLTAADNLVKNIDNPERYNSFVKSFFGRKARFAKVQTKLVGRFGNFLPKRIPISFDPDFGVV